MTSSDEYYSINPEKVLGTGAAKDLCRVDDAVLVEAHV
jgi:hypothetical protein